MTERAEVTFTVKESASGRPWIAIEPLSGDMRDLKGSLGFDLAGGTSLEAAREVASFLRHHIKSLTLTGTEK